MSRCFNQIAKYGHEAAYSLNFATNGEVPDGPEEDGGYEYETFLPILPGALGPLGFPVGYNDAGDIFEHYYHSHPVLIYRGYEAAKGLQERYYDLTRYFQYLDNNKNRIEIYGDRDEISEMESLKNKFNLSEKPISAYALGITAGMLMALSWAINHNCMCHKDFEDIFGLVQEKIDLNLTESEV